MVAALLLLIVTVFALLARATSETPAANNVRDNLVTRELWAALNEVFAVFEPLGPENAEGANVRALGDEDAEKLRAKLGDQIEIINVIVPLVNCDQATRDRINALNVEKANTRVAEPRAKTAEAEARANEILAASVSNDPNVLVSKCLDAARKAGISPLGCWPNTTAVPARQPVGGFASAREG